MRIWRSAVGATIARFHRAGRLACGPERAQHPGRRADGVSPDRFRSRPPAHAGAGLAAGESAPPAAFAGQAGRSACRRDAAFRVGDLAAAAAMATGGALGRMNWHLRFLGVGARRRAELGSSAAVLERDGAPLLLIDCGPDTLTATWRLRRTAAGGLHHAHAHGPCRRTWSGCSIASMVRRRAARAHAACSCTRRWCPGCRRASPTIRTCWPKAARISGRRSAGAMFARILAGWPLVRRVCDASSRARHFVRPRAGRQLRLDRRHTADSRRCSRATLAHGELIAHDCACSAIRRIPAWTISSANIRRSARAPDAVPLRQ